jgi:S-phase kinase-associated protein 1
MSIHVSLADNSVHSLSIEFIQLSRSFKDDETTHIHVSLPVFNKIKEFGEFYLDVQDKKEKKLFENPDQIWDKENSIQTWCDKFLIMSPSELIELTNESHKLNIKPLLDLCCYHTAQIIRDKTTTELRTLFNVSNDFSPEEERQLEKDTEWNN